MRILFIFIVVFLSVSWTPTSNEHRPWNGFVHGMRSEFLPLEIKPLGSDPILDIPIDLQNKIPETGTVLLVDFRIPSDQKRLWVVSNRRVKVHCRVAHGKNSGENITRHFSNDFESNMSCMGSFVTGEAYTGEKGRAMRIHGLEKGINDHAFERGIVFHSGDYISNLFVMKHGRIGRSLGCFVTEKHNNYRIINLCRNGVKMYVSGHQAVKF